MGLSPVDRPHRGGDGPRLAGGTVLHRGAADATSLGRGGHRLGLACEGLIHHAPGDRLTDLNGQLLQLGESGAPGQALGSKDLVEEMFCDPLNELLLINDDRGRIGGMSHP